MPRTTGYFSAVLVRSPNAYCAPLDKNKVRASANVIHPRSSGSNADNERVSVVSVVASSRMASISNLYVVDRRSMRNMKFLQAEARWWISPLVI